MSGQRPNVKLGAFKRPVAISGEVNIGTAKPIHLPTLEEQKAGWYCERAAELTRQFPLIYKPITDKGGK